MESLFHLFHEFAAWRDALREFHSHHHSSIQLFEVACSLDVLLGSFRSDHELFEEPPDGYHRPELHQSILVEERDRLDDLVFRQLFRIGCINMDRLSSKVAISHTRNALGLLQTPDIMTFSEVSASRRSLNQLSLKQGYGTGCYSLVDMGDSLGVWVNPSVFEIEEYVSSREGRYMLSKLSHLESGCHFLHVGVHLFRNPGKRKKAFDFIVKAVTREVDLWGVDGVVIGGDFNSRSYEIQLGLQPLIDDLKGVSLAFPGDTITTTGNSCIDNIASSHDSNPFIQSEVLSGFRSFNHFPIVTTYAAKE